MEGKGEAEIFHGRISGGAGSGAEAGSPVVCEYGCRLVH